MRATAPQQQSNSRDEALAAIAEAHRLVAQADQKLAQFDKLEKKRTETYDLSDACLAGPVEKSWRNSFMSRRFVGVLALTCIGGAVLAWQSSLGQVAPEPISTSSVPIKKNEEPAKRPAPLGSDSAARANVGPPEPEAQATPQRAPIAAPMPPELAQQIQMIVRALANVEQGIEQLKTEQSQMAYDNAELAEHLKAALEIARRNADLTEDLKAAQAQMARDNKSLAEQFKTSQDQMAGIAGLLKESQEQATRPVASAQKPRPRTPGSSPPTTANSTSRLVSTSPPPPARVQTQPKQQ
jgi:hypothetical protein